MIMGFTKHITSFISIFLMAFGFIFISVAASSYLTSSAVFKEGVSAYGEVTRLEISDSTYKPVIRYTTNDGREIEFLAQFSSNPPAYKPGDMVEIIYDPENPYNA